MIDLEKTTDNPDEWNQRYMQYARVHGHKPKAMILVDRARCNGTSNMMYFIFWVDEKWQEFFKIYPQYKIGTSVYDGATDEGHKIFDAWLTTLPVRILPYPVFFALEYVDVKYA